MLSSRNDTYTRFPCLVLGECFANGCLWKHQRMLWCVVVGLKLNGRLVGCPFGCERTDKKEDVGQDGLACLLPILCDQKMFPLYTKQQAGRAHTVVASRPKIESSARHALPHHKGMDEVLPRRAAVCHSGDGVPMHPSRVVRFRVGKVTSERDCCCLLLMLKKFQTLQPIADCTAHVFPIRDTLSGLILLLRPPPPRRCCCRYYCCCSVAGVSVGARTHNPQHRRAKKIKSTKGSISE